MQINIDRIRENLLKVGEIGRVEGRGITRLAYSKEFEEAAKDLIDLMEKANLDVTRDGVKNIFGKRAGDNKNYPSIMVGSHLDTVPNGGIFDGALGVIAALEVINVLNENNIRTKHPIELVAFNAEEGSAIGGTFGSRVVAGLQDPYEDGLIEKLDQYGMDINDVKKSVRNTASIKTFLELHVEQGANLYEKGIPIGIPTGIFGITRYGIVAKGEANHAGTTPMRLRKDPMIGAAKLIIEIDRIVKEIGEPLVATIGVIKASPGTVNVIPGTVEFIVELRDIDNQRIEEAVNKFKNSAHSIGGDIGFEFNLLINKPPTMLNKEVIEVIKNACLDKKIDYQITVSGAGHDAKSLAEKVPTGMIFVPSKDGKSHCPEEWTDWESIKTGVEVLLDTIMKLDSLELS
ncbi:MAG: hypothetical protein JM58_14620 [Peptococcaceae bacterium BICA1-8]|nr:MAG: hypothetical protein JM58_14620 [Peptococcaceae bacterium BICA1-8]